MYVTRRAHGDATISRMSLDGAESRPLVVLASIYGFAITPDSKRIVYATDNALMSVAIDRGAPSLIAKTPSFLEFLRITPDGRTVVFTAHHNNALKLFSVPISGGAITRLTDERARNASISPDGLLLACAYQMGDRGSKLAIIPISGGTPRVLACDGEMYRWSRDGKGILYVKFDGRIDNLWYQPIAGGPPHPLTSFSEGYIANFEPASDGTIVLTHYIETRDVVLLAGK